METDVAWERWGQQDPYFGVLTDSKYRTAAMTPQAKEEFFASGRSHAAHVLAVCRSLSSPGFAPRRALDFGCGVGRTLIPLAALATEVVGADVAPSMLAEARRNCSEQKVVNASFVLSDDTLVSVPGQFDLIHSSIVLQHVPTDRGRRLFALLLKKLEVGGFGAIHFTFALAMYPATFGRPVKPLAEPTPSLLMVIRSSLKQGLARLPMPIRRSRTEHREAPLDPEMQMNCYEFSDLMFILQRAGIRNVFIEFTDHGGALGAFLYFQSNTDELANGVNDL